MNVLVAHTSGEVAQFGEEIVEKVSIAYFKQFFQGLYTVHYFEFLKDQHAEATHDFELRRKPAEGVLENLGFDGSVELFVLEQTGLPRLSDFCKKLEVETGKVLLVDWEPSVERD